MATTHDALIEAGAEAESGFEDAVDLGGGVFDVVVSDDTCSALPMVGALPATNVKADITLS